MEAGAADGKRRGGGTCGHHNRLTEGSHSIGSHVLLLYKSIALIDLAPGDIGAISEGTTFLHRHTDASTCCCGSH